MNFFTVVELGYPDQALETINNVLTLARECAHPAGLAGALWSAALLHQLRRKRQAAQEAVEAFMALATEQGNAKPLARGMILHGWALFSSGQETAGIGQMRQGLAALQTTGGEVRRPLFLALLAEAYGGIGQIEKGLKVLAEALAAVEYTRGRFYEAELQRLQGELLRARAAEPDTEAETCFQ